MTVLDANILLYVHNEDAPQHSAAVSWLQNFLRSREVIGLPWLTLWAFLRVSTNARLWPNPKSSEEAFQIIHDWIAQPGVLLLNPGPRHAEILEGLVIRYGAGGALVSDAALAAIAVENGATLASTDRNFSRFGDLRWVNPLD